MKLFSSNLLKFAIIFGTTLLVTSCGGGGGATPPAATITSITPVGMVQSSTSKAISLTGTNFATGMTLSVTDSLGGSYTTGTVTALSSSVITSSVTIPTAPTNHYVTITLKSSNGTTQATTILGVASLSKSLATDIQPIFNANCTSCHNASAAGGLNLTTGTTGATSMYAASTVTGCTTNSRFRISPGDSRRTSSVLIDKILVASTLINACAGVGMPMSGTALTPTQIQDIIDWVAGGIKP